MSGDTSVDLDRVTSAAGRLRGHGADMQRHGDALKAKTEESVGHGPIGQIADTFLKKIMTAAGEGAATAIKNFLEKSAEGLERTVRNVVHNDTKVGSAFSDLEHDGAAMTPGTVLSALEGRAGASTERVAVAGGPRVETARGYTYRIDAEGRVTRVEGKLRLDASQRRDPAAQLAAGRGKGRLPTDQGGHFIGRRFDGPTEDFNHFAQDGNFNMGRYKALENQWQKQLQAGRPVHVAIDVRYPDRETHRPSRLDVTWTNGQHSFRRQFLNRAAPGARSARPAVAAGTAR